IPVALAQDGPHASAAGGLGLAPVGGVAHNWLVAACERAAIETRVAADYRALKWSKLALNLVANAACAILDVAPARLVALEGALALELRALRETFAVMAAQELRTLDLPRYPVNLLRRVVALPTPLASALLARRFAAARSGKLPSLLLDLRAGRRRTEIDALCGAVVAAGRRHAIPTPVNATYQRLVNDLTAEPALRERYRGRIDLFCSEVERETNRRLA
ncbi:MAG: ketopantoate reductase family protein, partial [Vulcanimicrobiaceae bacterium]